MATFSADAQTLTIDSELEQICPPLQAEELAELRKSLEADGCRDHITTWAGAEHDDTIIDGHNRYRLCLELGIGFRVKRLKFDSREEVIQWMCRNQLGRRNLTETQRKVLIGRLYNERKKQVGNPKAPEAKTAKTPDEYQLDHGDPIDIDTSTASKIAAEQNVSSPTVKRAGKLAAAVDEIKDEQLKRAILAETSDLTRGEIQTVAKQPTAAAQRALAEQIVDDKRRREAARAGRLDTSAVSPPKEGTPDKPTIPVLDDNNHRVPASLERAFTFERDQFRKIRQTLIDLRTHVNSLENTLGAAWIDCPNLSRELKALAYTVFCGMPHRVCLVCRGTAKHEGETCKRCRAGFVSRLAFSNLPPEFKGEA